MYLTVNGGTVVVVVLVPFLYRKKKYKGKTMGTGEIREVLSLISMCGNHAYPVADPGFPRGGGANP